MILQFLLSSPISLMMTPMTPSFHLSSLSSILRPSSLCDCTCSWCLSFASVQLYLLFPQY
jgi:hypothetical protein